MMEIEKMVFVTGTSRKHLLSMATDLVLALKKRRLKVVGASGAEGQDTDDWMIVDCGNFVVHFMKGELREIMDLERAWRERDFPCHRNDLDDDNWVQAYPFSERYGDWLNATPSLSEEEEKAMLRNKDNQGKKQ